MSRARAVAGLTIITLALCGGACASDDAGDRGVEDAGSIAFRDVYGEILLKRCSDAICHGAGGAGELDMSTRDKAYAALVGVAAAGPKCKTSGLTRVVQADPDASLLYQKLTSPRTCGDAMPLGGTLDANELARIEAWIAAGAPND
jgi:hypothetical protein